jgi:hypothetical protein
VIPVLYFIRQLADYRTGRRIEEVKLGRVHREVNDIARPDLAFRI